MQNLIFGTHKRLRYGEAERFGSLEIDHQFVLGRQQDWSDFEHRFVERGRCPRRVVID